MCLCVCAYILSLNSIRCFFPFTAPSPNVHIYIYIHIKRHPDEPSFVVPDCLREKVESGDLGRKTGRGFYVWDGDRCLDPVV